MPDGTVLVTGASTGIGEATALHLKALGFDAVGAVRRDDDAHRLRRQGLRTVKLDVTDSRSIAGAREELGDTPLAGLVNNAGIAVAGPIEFLPLDQLRLQLEVNLVGQVAVIQEFLPALRAGQGRIVNLSSIGGRVALPLVAPYNASKFALEAISDSLRRELHGQGVDVILIEPGGVRTPIWRKGNEVADELLERMPPEAEQLYGKLIAGLRRQTDRIEHKTGIEPGEVAEIIGRAMTARRPRTRYLVGTDAKIRGPMSKVMPDRLMDRAIVRTITGGR
jgi:NAD(P)-dependent dehydrogenase (short-subunit alcohol dehydrogenase family)